MLKNMPVIPHRYNISGIYYGPVWIWRANELNLNASACRITAHAKWEKLSEHWKRPCFSNWFTRLLKQYYRFNPILRNRRDGFGSPRGWGILPRGFKRVSR